jgi:YidC/Oxa1 family membrane protein insertase
MRSALFPWYLKQTRSTILANNLRPEVQVLQSACQALREQGKVDESHKKMRELGKFMSDKGINPAKILGLSLLPVPFFMATFFAIRNMASQPIASFLNEGLFWFKDLSIADPYYILPALSTLTLLLTMEV